MRDTSQLLFFESSVNRSSESGKLCFLASPAQRKRLFINLCNPSSRKAFIFLAESPALIQVLSMNVPHVCENRLDVLSGRYSKSKTAHAEVRIYNKAKYFVTEFGVRFIMQG